LADAAKGEKVGRIPMVDKHASRAWRSRLREILNRDWNPIGGCPEDEYDGYVGRIAAMICDHADDDELLAYLKWAEVGHTGAWPSNTLRSRSRAKGHSGIAKAWPCPFNPGRSLSSIARRFLPRISINQSLAAPFPSGMKSGPASARGAGAGCGRRRSSARATRSIPAKP
jgi:hypothetical protein